MSREIQVRFCESRGVKFPPATHLAVLCDGTQDHVEALREEISGVLATMGLAFSEAKTRVVHMSEGLDFLGFRIRDCSGPRPRVVIGWPWSGCEGSVRDRAVLRAAGGAGGGPGTDDRSAAGPNRRAGCGDRRAEAAVGRLLAQPLQAAVERRAGQAGAEVAARPVGAQARRAAGAGGPHAAADRAAG